MRGKKRLLAAVLATSGALRVARLAAGSRLIVLAYHRVLPRIAADFSGDEELVSALLDDFGWQVRHLADHYDPISIEHLVGVLRGTAELPPRAVLVTFDDGCIDSARYAAPVLTAHRVPAVFFVASGYIASQRLYWFDEAVHLLSRADQRQVRIESLGLDVTLPADMRGRKAVAARVVQALKVAGATARLQALEEIRQICGSALPDDVIDANRPMGWDELRNLCAQGLSVGSHSVTHPVLAQLEDDELAHELSESKRRIEQELDAPCESIAYPLGGDSGHSVSGAISVDDRVRGFTAAAGYVAGFTYVPGVTRLGHDDPLLLRRVPVERYLSRHEFAARLCLPDVFV